MGVKKKTNNFKKNSTKLYKTSLKSIKKVFSYVKDKFLKYYKSYVLWLCIPFILLELFMILMGRDINYVNHRVFGPIFFTISWIVLFIGVSLSFKRKIGKTIYICICSIFIILFLVHGVYYSITRNFFDFSLMESAKEGTPYLISSLKNCSVFVYIGLVILIVALIYSLKHFPNNKTNDYKKLGIIIVIFLVLHTIAPLTLGKANKDLTWNSWRNARNIYNSFNDSNKSMKTSWFYEYTFRNFYITYLKSQEKENEEDIEFLESAYAKKKSSKNNYTGKLKNQNLILIQLEGIDKWLLNKNDTPTLYKLMNEGINFDKHYSFYSGGGSTFNSEFAVNTGLTTPISYTKNAYALNKNVFPNTLAKIFKNNGYTVNSFHMNNGEYYSRTVNYKNWGYDNYYGLTDIQKYDDQSYMLDRELILNEKFNELMFPSEGNFVDYIITYSAHVPFNNTDGVCKMLYDLDQGDKETEFIQMNEEECVRRQARETDYMVELLLKNLKEKGLYDNTALVIFTDHYLFTLNDQSILERYKNTYNNLINNTPWFIWSKNIKSKKVSSVTSQLNILPTVLNLYGISFSANDYIGEDALSSKYNPIVFFSDYSWYDGKSYAEGGIITSGKKIDKEKLEEKNEYINYLIRKNDLTLKYNYFKKLGSD